MVKARKLVVIPSHLLRIYHEFSWMSKVPTIQSNDEILATRPFLHLCLPLIFSLPFFLRFCRLIIQPEHCPFFLQHLDGDFVAEVVNNFNTLYINLPWYLNNTGENSGAQLLSQTPNSFGDFQCCTWTVSHR